MSNCVSFDNKLETENSGSVLKKAANAEGRSLTPHFLNLLSTRFMDSMKHIVTLKTCDQNLALRRPLYKTCLG